jgi:hypothetical protein
VIGSRKKHHLSVLGGNTFLQSIIKDRDHLVRQPNLR